LATLAIAGWLNAQSVQRTPAYARPDKCICSYYLLLSTTLFRFNNFYPVDFLKILTNKLLAAFARAPMGKVKSKRGSKKRKIALVDQPAVVYAGTTAVAYSAAPPGDTCQLKRLPLELLAELLSYTTTPKGALISN
jgi:hypothetical protein